MTPEGAAEPTPHQIRGSQGCSCEDLWDNPSSCELSRASAMNGPSPSSKAESLKAFLCWVTQTHHKRASKFLALPAEKALLSAQALGVLGMLSLTLPHLIAMGPLRGFGIYATYTYMHYFWNQTPM